MSCQSGESGGFFMRFKKRNGDTLKGALAFIPWALPPDSPESKWRKCFNICFGFPFPLGVLPSQGSIATNIIPMSLSRVQLCAFGKVLQEANAEAHQLLGSVMNPPAKATKKHLNQKPGQKAWLKTILKCPSATPKTLLGRNSITQNTQKTPRNAPSTMKPPKITRKRHGNREHFRSHWYAPYTGQLGERPRGNPQGQRQGSLGTFRFFFLLQASWIVSFFFR